MKVENLSASYQVRPLDETDFPTVLNLYQSNPLYFKHCPPQPSLETIRQDSLALPPGKMPADKFFLGFWQGEELVAVLDMVTDFPEKGTVYIGLFMVAGEFSGCGVGTSLMTEILAALSKDYAYSRLAYVISNPQAKHFWLKNGFRLIGEIRELENYSVELLERKLK